MFKDLSEKLEGIFAGLRSRGRISESDVRNTMREVRRALLEADVSYKVVRDFISRVEEKALGEEILKSFTPGQQIIKIVHQELTSLLGGSASTFSLRSSFASVMVVGLQGSGKTTFCAKLGVFLRKRKRRPLLVAMDVYRPAALEQLEILGKEVGVPVFASRTNNAKMILDGARERARELMCDTLILDTAGRLHIDEEMMHELEVLKTETRPEEVLLVLDSMTGQVALGVAKAFQERLSISGVVLTKLDGDARGGAALSVVAVTGMKIRFASTGEKVGDLELFYPDRMAGRILGMGDVLTLIEKAQESLDEERARKLEKKIREQAFTLADFLHELKRLRKMWPLDQVLEMIPGLPKPGERGFELSERQFVETEAIIHSMTVAERTYPHIIDGSRRRRIARGSGTSVQKVNRLLKQFQEMKKMIKYFSRSRGRPRLPFL